MSESTDTAPSSDFTELLDNIKAPAKRVRQGLPAEYRMRHDAHYVEELTTQTRPQEMTAQSAGVPMSAALRDLCQEFEGLASCFNLIDRTARPLRERLGLSLAKVGVQRSIRYAQNLRLLLEEPHPVMRDVRVDDLVRHAFGDFKEELRLTEATLILELPDGATMLRGDAALLRTALRGCAGAAISLVELSGTAGNIHVSIFATDDVVHCELRQDSYPVEPQQLVKMFDLESPDRASGRSVAVALNAARRMAQLHAGQFQARRTTSGGCAFLFSLPKSAAAEPPVTPN